MLAILVWTWRPLHSWLQLLKQRLQPAFLVMGAAFQMLHPLKVELDYVLVQRNQLHLVCVELHPMTRQLNPSEQERILGICFA